MTGIYGQQPEHDCLFAACDSAYFIDHAIPLIYSANAVNNNIHIHIVNPSPVVVALTKIIDEDCCNIITTFSFHDADIDQFTDEQRRVYYSTMRFVFAPWVMQNNISILIIDTDCYMNKKFLFDNHLWADVGIYFRDSLPGTVGWEKEGTRVAAGIVYYKKTSTVFAQEVANFILKNQLAWFIDQVALWRTFDAWQDKLEIFSFNEKDMDWSFNKGSMIWTGKGSLKHTNKKYINRKNQHLLKFDGWRDRFWGNVACQ